MTEAVPDETTLCKFRHLLEANGLNKLFFDAINKNLGNHASSFRPMFVPQTDTYFDTLSVRKEKAGKCDYDFTANSIFYCRS